MEEETPPALDISAPEIKEKLTEILKQYDIYYHAWK